MKTLAIAFLLCAIASCGSEDEVAGPRLEGVVFELGGGMCSDDSDACENRTLGVQAPNVLVLADNEGEQQSPLTEDDFAVLSRQMNTRSFRDALADAEDGCPPAFDSGTTIYLRFNDGSAKKITNASGCFALNETKNPLNDFLVRLVEFKNEALSCPPPWDDGDPVPDVRPLCAACGGRC